MPNNDQNQAPDQQLQATAQQPATPAQGTTAAPTAQPTAPNPYASAKPLSTPAEPHSGHVAMFDRILRLTGSPTTTVQPDGTVTQDVSRPTLGRSILAGALAGLMTPTRYRKGTYGPVVSGDATASGAFQAGRGQQTAQNDAAQKTSDAQQTKKLAVIKNNVDMMHQYAALAQQQHQELQGVADRNNATILKDLGDYDTKIDDPTQKLVLGKGLTMDQALDKLKGKMTSQNAVIDGYQDVMDPDTHQMSVQPTFSVINPDAKIQMSESAAAELAKFKPAYKNAYALTGGDIRMPVGQYLADVHTANSLSAAESFMKRADSALGVKPDMDLAAAAAKDPRVIQSVKEAENALAQGGSTADVLDRIQKSPNGNVLLTAMGIDQDKATKYINDTRNEQARQAALAKEGGIGDKAPAPASMIADLTAAAKKLHPDQAQAIMAGINPAGLTVGEAEKIKNNILQAQNTNTANSQPTAAGPTPTKFVFNPDAPTMDSPSLRQDLTKQGVKVPANFEALYGIAHNANPLTTLPTNPRKGSNQMSAQEGLAFIRQYINPNYQEGDYQAAASLSKELASTRQGTAGGTLYNAGTASQHLELLDEAAKALGNHDVQALNRLANTFGVAVGDSPAVTFKAIAEQVNGEVGKVVAGGTPHEAELAELRSNLNSDQSPEQTKKVIKAYVGLMAGRINEINDRSQQYFNRDVKGVSPTTAKVFNAYGVPAPGQVAVTVNGKTGFIPKSQLKTFQQKYPNATVGGQ
jgi:hypothetical protein